MYSQIEIVPVTSDYTGYRYQYRVSVTSAKLDLEKLLVTVTFFSDNSRMLDVLAHALSSILLCPQAQQWKGCSA